jgi:hypothetical protein
MCLLKVCKRLVCERWMVRSNFCIPVKTLKQELAKFYKHALSKLNRSAWHVVRKTRRKYDYEYDNSTCAPEPSKLPEGHHDVI